MAPVEIEIIHRDVASPGPASPMLDTRKNVAATSFVEELISMSESGFSTIKTTAEETIIPEFPEGTTADMACVEKTTLENSEETTKENTVESSQEKTVESSEEEKTEETTEEEITEETIEESIAPDETTKESIAPKETTKEEIAPKETTKEEIASNETTPETSKEAVVSYFGYAKEYMASFGLSQIVLKLGDKGLQMTTVAVKLTGLEETAPVKPVLKGIEDLRRHARAVRRAGAKVAGIKPAKTIGEASLVGAVAEIFGLNFFLSVVGLQLIPANSLLIPTGGELDTSVEEETVVVKLSDEKIAGYKSDEDPNFVLSNASEISAKNDCEEVKIEEEKIEEEKTEETTHERTEETSQEKTEETSQEKTEETSQEKTEETTVEEKTEETTAEEITEETTNQEIAEEKIEEKTLWEKVVETTGDVIETIKEKVEDVIETIEEKVDGIETIKEKVEDIIEKDVIEPIEAKIDVIEAVLDVSGAEEADELD
eukprot:GFUD01023459.1.p1 GENE.GFUD01023459.1~~GFUD01023459.1.p1  ORF type:complete len:487 (-),score=141.07 GFUD01023459.1:74-1534(-)